MSLRQKLDEALDRIKDLEKKLKESGKEAKEFGELTEDAIKKSVKELGNLNNLLGKSVNTIKDMNKEVRDLHVAGALDTKEATDLNKGLERIAKQLIHIKKIKKEDRTWAEQRAEIKKLNKMIDQMRSKTNLARNSAKSFADHMEDAGPSFMKGWASFNKASKKGQTTIQSYQGMFNKAGNSLGKMPGLMKGFGSAAKGVSASLGGITKVIAGWPGAIFMALKAVWDVGMAADQFVKDANKAFASVRGPDIMTADVRKQFKTFNDQIFNARENIRVGLDVTQIRELMEAVVQAGANIQNLNKGLLSYRDAIYIAGKASKTLGLALPQVGSMVGKLLTNFRMDLESIDKAFVQVAFDAQKSGLSTDRFWTTVENASASLALYGTFIGAASKTMKRFTEDMVGGADDAAEATEDMYSVFKSGNLKAQATLLSMAKQAGVNLDDIFKNMSTEFKDQAVRLQSEIELMEAKGTKTPEDVAQLKRLRSELASAQSKSQRALDVVGKNAVSQTTEIGMLAKEAPQLLIETIRRMTNVGDLTKISRERMIVAIKALENVGVKEKTVRLLVEQAKVTKKSLENLLDSSENFFAENNKDFQLNRANIANAIMEASKPGKDQAANTQILVDLLKESLGMDQGMAETWANIIKTDKETANKIASRIEKGDKNSLKSIDGLLMASKFINKFQIATFKNQEKTDKELAKSSEETFDEIVKGTLSYNEMVKMGKDELYWTMANWKVATIMNKTVADIYYWLQGESTRLSQSQKLAQEQLKLMGQQNAGIGNLLKDVGEGNISAKTQVAMVQHVSQNLKDLQSAIAVEEGLQGAFENAMRSTDPSKALTNAIMAAEKDKDKKLANRLKEEKKNFEALRERKKGRLDEEKYFKNLAEANRSTLERNKQERGKQEEIKNKLVELNDINKKVFEIQKLKLMGDEKSLIAIADQIQATAGEDVNKIEKMATNMGLTLGDVKRAFEAKKISTVGIEKRMAARKIFKKTEKTLASMPQKPIKYVDPMEAAYRKEMGYQGLQKPIQVTSPGSAVLHPGELILPKTYSEFKAVPAMNEPMGVHPGGGVGRGAKEITINVTATEKDLASKIANEVRAVINQEYIGVA